MEILSVLELVVCIDMMECYFLIMDRDDVDFEVGIEE